MRHLLVLFAATSTLAAGAAFAQPRDEAAPEGGYWESCRDVNMSGYGRNLTLTAQCLDMRGRWRPAALRVEGCGNVENMNGALVCTGGESRSEPYRQPDRDRPWRDGRGPWRDERDVGGRRGITFFTGPDFQGQPFSSEREITNMPRGFNDRAMSVRIRGGYAWEVCENSDFQGRCVVIDHDVRDLRRFGLGERVSSARPVR